MPRVDHLLQGDFGKQRMLRPILAAEVLAEAIPFDLVFEFFEWLGGGSWRHLHDLSACTSIVSRRARR